MDVRCERYRPPSASYVDLAAGRRHSCGLLADGRAQCWGASSFYGFYYANHYSDDPSNYYTGTASSWTSGNFVQIDAQGGLNCGQRTDASLYCWTSEGWFPRSHSLYGEPPAPYESGSYTDFAVTDSQVCALDLDGRAACWPFEHGDEPLTAAPRSRLGNLSFAAIDAGAAHVCGLHRDGAIYCWGSDEAGQLNAPAGTSWVQISAGAGHTCALDADGKAACWGDDSFGQGTPPRNSRFSTLSAGELHTCGLRLDGTAQCWGSDIDGQATPPDDTVFAVLSSGAHHTCGLTTTGAPRCWGLDAYGQATPPAALARFARLFISSPDSSDRVTCGLRDDGLAQCWGRWWNPRLPVRDGARFAKIAAGRDFACGLLLDGRASCWRYYPDSAYPDLDAVVAEVPGDLSFVELVIVGHRACGLTGGGAIRCWGQRQDLNGRDLPSPPSGKHAAIASTGWNACSLSHSGIIECWSDSGEHPADLRWLSLPQRGATSVGEHFDPGDATRAIYRTMTLGSGARYGPEGRKRDRIHGCALHQHQTVTCWGANEFGQASPPSGLRFSSVAAGGRHTCGITVEGRARCWGADDAGQSTPPADLAFSEVHAEGDSTCGLRTTGDVICWGDYELSAPAQLDPFVVNLPEQHFTDIMALDRLGIFDGTECSTHRFCADAPLDRATLAVWLDRLLAHVTPQLGGNQAPAVGDDVRGGRWWAPHVQRLADLSVMGSCDDAERHWCPDERVSREALEEVLFAAFGTHVHAYSAVISKAATVNALAMVRADVLSTCVDRSAQACRSGTISRGQAATVLNRWAQHIERLSPPGFTSISANSNGGCGRRADATVECWGHDGSAEAHVTADDRVLDVFYDGLYWCGRTASRQRICRGWDGYNYSHVREALHLASRTEVAFGRVYACGVEPDSAVTCVGGLQTDGGGWPYEEADPSIPLTYEDRYGRIPGQRFYSTLLPQTGRFTQVAVGYLHRCALLLDGTAVCWGKNEFGEASPPQGGRFSQLALGASHSCGLRSDGSVDCWGFDEDGRSSPPSIEMITPAAPSGPAAGILGTVRAVPLRLRAIAAAGAATCGLTLEGLVFCWGTSLARKTPMETNDWWNSHGFTLGPPGAVDGQVFAEIAATEGYFCAERPDGSHRCWGSHLFRPSLEATAGFIEVSTKDWSACGRRTDGTVECWGVSGLTPTDSFETITTADTYTCGRTDDGARSCWTLHPDHGVPAEAEAVDIVQWSGSSRHACALRADGSVSCWGRSDDGETAPPAGRAYRQISAGDARRSDDTEDRFQTVHVAHTCAVGLDGKIDCWGDNSYGQSTPPATTDFVKVAASGAHACGIRRNGHIECWGHHWRGPPYGGETATGAAQYTDVAVGAYDGAVYPNASHVCGLRIDGIVDCWGATYSPNKPYNRYEPDSRSRFTSISSGRTRACGVRTDGAIECWGIPAFIAY